MSSQRFPSLDPDEFPTKHKPSHHHNKHTHTRPMNRLLMWMLLLCSASAVAMLSANRYLQSVHVLDGPILPHVDVPPLDMRVHIEDERLLRLVVDECLKAEDSVIWVDQSREMVVQESNWVGKQCPPLDIMIPRGDRRLTACTDAALYVIHAAGRIIPLQYKQQYDSYCGAATARLFLDKIYEPFISLRPDILHLMLVSPARMYSQDSKLHKHINVFLCKTKLCRDLLKKHIGRMGWRSHVWLMGHTSSDPSVDLPLDAEALKGTLGPSFLHIQGPNHHQTQQLLQCWRSQPDFPKLTVVGRFAWQDVRDSRDASNIEFYPPVSEVDSGNQQLTLSYTNIRQLQLQTPIHLYTSEAEDPLLAINEAKASGALVVAVNHPPASELIDPTDGYLISPERVLSYTEEFLGQYAPLHAVVGVSRLCDAVEDVLGFPQQEVYARGQQARQAYLYDKAVFMARMQDLRAFLQQRSHGVYTMDHRVGLWQHGGVLLKRHASSKGTSNATVLHDLCHDAAGAGAVECIQSAMLE